MKQTIYFLWVALCAVILSGCATQKKSTTSFYEVGEKLDKGGDFYLYMNAEDLLSKLDSRVTSLEKIILLTSKDKESTANIKQGFALIKSLIKTSGIEEINAVGASSIKLDNGSYRNIAYLYHKPGDDKGIIWKAVPVRNKTQRLLKLLPKETVFASASDIKFNKLLRWLENELVKSNIGGVAEKINEGKSIAVNKGVDIDKVLNSLNGAYGMLLTLDPVKKSKIPVGGTLLEIPRPAAAIVAEVSDDYAFNLLKKFVPMSKASVRKDGVQEINVFLPQFLDIDLLPTILLTKNHLLIIATSKTLANDILKLDQGGDEAKGLIATEEFKKASLHIPLSGNGFSYTSKRYREVAIKIQFQTFKKGEVNPSVQEIQKKIMDKVSKLYKDKSTFIVVQNTPTGILVVGNAPISQKMVLVALPVGFSSIAAGITLPALNSAREKARRIACISNLKQIGLAIKQYSMDYDDHYPPKNWVETLVKNEYLSDLKMYTCPSCSEKCNGTSATASYWYFGATFTEANSADIPLVIEKIGNHKNYINILFADGHAQGFTGKFQNMEQVIMMLNSKNHYSKSELSTLLLRAKEIDAR